MLTYLIDEAAKVLGLQQILRMILTASQGCDIDTLVGVDTISVAAESEGVRIRSPADSKILHHIIVVVGGSQWATVPILRDAFLSRLPCETESTTLSLGVVCAFHSKELLELLAVEITVGLFLGMI